MRWVFSDVFLTKDDFLFIMKITKKLILPVGLIFALVAAISHPEWGIFCENNYGVEISVIAIFIVSGYVHRFSEISISKNLIFLMIMAVLSSLFLTPLIGFFLAKLLLPAAFAIGIIVIVLMPPTLSSGVVITEVAGGNSVLAILLTVLLNMIGLITIPILFNFLSMDSDAAVAVDPIILFIKLFSIIFLPFLIGHLLKKFFPIIRGIAFVKLIPSLSVVVTVWICLSSSVDDIYKIHCHDVVMILLIALLIHVVFLLFNYLITLIFPVSKKDLEAFVFVVSQKTMPLAVLVLSTISNNIGQGIVACVLYHFLQILVDSVIAAFISKKKVKG
jgi:solute carrier family 10 (sodium/bile acid cotransporter), member 7